VITEDFEVDIEAEEETTSSLPETTAAPGLEEATTEEEFVGSLPEPEEDKPNEQTFIPVIIGPDGSPQIAPGYEGPGPSGSGMYNCTELGGGVFNCTIVAGPCKGDNLVTSDAMAVKNHIENIAAGNLCGTAGTGAASGPGLGQPEPESPAGPATAEPAGSTASSSPAEDDAEEPHFHSLPLSSMTYQEICGKTPWLNKTFRAQHASPRSGRRIGGSEVVPATFWQQFRRGKIVNGDKAEYGEWPWQVSLRQWRTATFLHKCGAALLSDTWAITAAHCVESVNPDELLLRMGEYDLNDEFPEPYSFQDRKVQIVASHPKFDPKTFEYDLALLRFYEPVTFQPNIIPVCVPDSDEDLVGQTAWVTGWGRLYEDGPLPAVLQEVDLPIINNSQCEAMYEKAGFREHIPHIFICAGYKEGGKDSCEGDSGGPMSVARAADGRYVLGGVISWGIGCAEKNQPGVYTRISEFRDWVNQILQY